jgi:hypothetical protein
MQIPRSSRRTHAGIVCLLAACSLPALVGSALDAQPRQGAERHAIRLHRPRVVGARARIELEGEKHQRLERRAGNAWEAQRNEDTFVSLRAEERVLAVNGIGKVTSADYVIETFEVRRGDQRTSPLPRGTVLHVERTPTGQAQMMVSGQPVATDVAEALSIVISGKASEVSDDQVFGSETPRRVGERWRMMDAIAERDLAREAHLEVDLSGEAQLVELTTAEGMPCVVVSATMNGRLNALPNLPPSATFESGAIAITQRGVFPTDGTTRVLSSELSMTLDTAFNVRAAPDQPVQRFRMQVREARRERAVPVP